MTNRYSLIPVVAIALQRSDGRILMQQRPEGKAHAGLWEFPGGKVELGESPEQALVREIAEELAITVRIEDLDSFTFASGGARPGSDSRSILLLLYRCHQWQGEPQNLDAAAIDWFELNDLMALPMPPLDVPLAKRLKEAFK